MKLLPLECLANHDSIARGEKEKKRIRERGPALQEEKKRGLLCDHGNSLGKNRRRSEKHRGDLSSSRKTTIKNNGIIMGKYREE